MLDSIKYPGWNQIDLHSHGLIDLMKDGSERNNNYTNKKFYDFVKEQGVKLKAVTNHNRFNFLEHIKHSIICSLLGVQYIPGIEIDCKFNKKSFHSVILFGPDSDLFKFQKDLEDIVNSKRSKKEEISFSKHDFGKLFGNMNFIFIPHAIKHEGIMYDTTSDEDDDDNIGWVVETIKNGLSMPCLLENTKDYHIYSVEERINKLVSSNKCKVFVGCIVNSDYNFDSDEARKNNIEKKPKYCIFSEPTYRGLEIAIRNYKTRFSTIDALISRNNYIEQIEFNNIDNADFLLKDNIKLSTGLNIIIGNSGTGKTLLLNEIYYQMTGKNLDVSSENKKINGNLYSGKINGIELFKLKLNEEKNKKIKIVEIPKIYNKILKCSESENLGEQFGIKEANSYREIINNYKTVLSKFENAHIEKENSISKGNVCISNINRSICFILDNEGKSNFYKLAKKVYKTTEKNSIDKKIKALDKLIYKRVEIKKYFEEIMLYLTNDEKIIYENIITNFNILIEKLEKVKSEEIFKYNKCLIDEKIYKIINLNIDKSIENLNGKEKNIILMKSSISEENNSLTNYIIECLTKELLMKKLNCSYPYDALKEHIEKNKNDYARQIIGFEKENLKNVILESSYLIDTKNIINKLKNFENINFVENADIKKSIIKLLEKGIYLSEKISLDIPLILELKVGDMWKNENRINPGDLAKTYMNYYFNMLIRAEQPDVILIDQPENDVDKTFLTETLSKFIKERKMLNQFIITTHDPILAINSDVNQIILSKLNDKNQITYSSIKLEEIDKEDLSYYGSNVVSEILDGGKSNVTLRYQIYGGELND